MEKIIMSVMILTLSACATVPQGTLYRNNVKVEQGDLQVQKDHAECVYQAALAAQPGGRSTFYNFLSPGSAFVEDLSLMVDHSARKTQLSDLCLGARGYTVRQ